MEDNKFLGTEKIGKLLKMFAIPCVLSLIIQALYNLVDQIFIGNSNLGQLGNTATGIVYPLTVIALALGLFIGDGSAACISINQGRNQTKETHKTIGTGITIGLITSIIKFFIRLFNMDNNRLSIIFNCVYFKSNHSFRRKSKICNAFNGAWSNHKHNT